MAITITPTSPIQGLSGSQYINDTDFSTNLFFTSPTSSYNYIVGVGIFGGQSQIVSSGILSGKYNASSTYNYRFDFDRYIKIPDDHSTLEASGTSGSLYFTGSNSCTISLAIDNTDLLAANILNGNLTSALSGEISVAAGKTTANISCSNLFEYNFSDRDSSNTLPPTSPQFIVKDSYYPLTLYKQTGTYTICEVFNSTTLLDSVNFTANRDEYIVGLIYIPATTTHMVLTTVTPVGTTVTTLYPVVGCYTPYYFWNPNGAFDVLYCSGNSNEVDNVSKESVVVGDSTVYTNITIRKQIKQNTGLALTQSQIYGLINSPFVYTVSGSAFKQYQIDTTSFEGYNGVQYGSRNVQLIFTDPKTYKRKTNKTISFFD